MPEAVGLWLEKALGHTAALVAEPTERGRLGIQQLVTEPGQSRFPRGACFSRP